MEVVGMRRIDEVILGPALTDEDAIGRVVGFEDGSGLVQSFVPGKGWVGGGTSLYSLTHAGGIDEEYLAELGYSTEDIKLILADPVGTEIED
jgi:hypothetical protein